MRLLSNGISVAVALVGLGWASAGLAASSVVNVALWDKGGEAMGNMPTAPDMGMAMTNAMKMDMAPVGLKVDKVKVPAGKVTFNVTNASQDVVHEMIVSPVKNPAKPLPYKSADLQIDEDAAGHLGEVSEMQPGAKGSLTLDLKPGTYILFCNVPSHYAMGMWTLLTVTG
ncbi:MAG: plastocyanin/azurin family copper-binding protein [Paracoccaceae bacterium]